MNVFKHLVVNLIMCTAFKLFYLSFEETAENPQFDKVNIYQIMGKKSRQERLYIFFCCLLTGGIWIAKNLCRLQLFRKNAYKTVPKSYTSNIILDLALFILYFRRASVFRRSCINRFLSSTSCTGKNFNPFEFKLNPCTEC